MWPRPPVPSGAGSSTVILDFAGWRAADDTKSPG